MLTTCSPFDIDVGIQPWARCNVDFHQHELDFKDMKEMLHVSPIAHILMSFTLVKNIYLCAKTPKFIYNLMRKFSLALLWTWCSPKTYWFICMLSQSSRRWWCSLRSVFSLSEKYSFMCQNSKVYLEACVQI